MQDSEWSLVRQHAEGEFHGHSSPVRCRWRACSLCWEFPSRWPRGHPKRRCLGRSTRASWPFGCSWGSATPRPRIGVAGCRSTRGSRGRGGRSLSRRRSRRRPRLMAGSEPSDPQGGRRKKPRPRRQGAAQKAGSGPGTVGASVSPNGVVVSLKGVEGAALAVETAQGKFSVPVDRLADGSVVSFLNDRVRVQRVFAQAPLLESPGQQDFPAAAPARLGWGIRSLARVRQPRVARAGNAPGLDRTARELRRIPTQRRRRPGPPAALRFQGRTGSAGNADRRDRAGPRRLAPLRCHGRGWQRPRGLDREAR